MCYHITRHSPNFVDGGESKTPIPFNTLQELLDMPFIKNFSEEQSFHRFSISDELLMAEFDEGHRWWVVGYIENNGKDTLDLPKWEAKYREESDAT